MFPVEKAKASCKEVEEFLKQDKTATLRNYYCTKIDAAIRSYSLAGRDRVRITLGDMEFVDWSFYVGIKKEYKKAGYGVSLYGKHNNPWDEPVEIEIRW